MALSDYISQRIYDAFRIDGVAQNKQSPEVITIATTVDDSTPIEVNVQQPISIDDSTPIEVDVQQPVSIDDNGGSITVDGDVNASLFDEAGNPFTTSNTLPISGPVVLQDPNDPARQAEFDNLFKIPVTIDVAHHEVHEGDTYSLGSSDDVAASGHECQLYIKTPATASPQKRMHVTVAHGGSGAHSFSGIEGITYSSGGADVTPVNHFRQITPKVSSVQAAKVGSDKASNAITYTGGTPLWPELFMGSGKASGGEGRGVDEWVLAPDTEYIFFIASGSTSTSISARITWYEHTDQ